MKGRKKKKHDISMGPTMQFVYLHISLTGQQHFSAIIACYHIHAEWRLAVTGSPLGHAAKGTQWAV